MSKFASEVQLKNPTPKEPMPELKINPKFRDLIPPLSEHELEALDAEIRYWARAYSPIITWNGTIIDGHHRYEICNRYSLPFKIEEREFEDEIAVKRWMIKNQFARRNLPIEERLRLAFEDTNLEELQAEAKERELAGKKIDPSKPVYTGQEKGRTLDKIAEKAGCSHVTAHDYKKIMDAGQLDRLKEESIKKVAKEIQHKEKKEAREQTLKATEFPKGKYRVIYADPPWSYNDKKAPGQGGAEEQYPTMSIEDICNMKVQDITDDNAVLFLWATTPLLQEGLDVMKAWGFTYKTLFTWDKVRPFPGNYNSVMQEFLFLGTKGSCLPDIDIKPSSIVRVEKGRHSEKPEEFRELIETLYKYGNKVELFARKQSSGWDVFGNQCS